MSIMANQIQMQTAKINSQNNQSNKKVSNSSSNPNSSFFDILQSMLGGNTVKTVKVQDSSNDFNDFAKNADNLKSKLQSNFKSDMKNIKETVDKVTALTVDKASTPAVSSSDAKDADYIDSVSEIVSRAVISDEENNSGTADANIQDIQINVTLILQLLGVPADIIEQAGEAISVLNMQDISNIDNSTGNSALLGINFSGLALSNNALANNINNANGDNILVNLNDAAKIFSDIAKMAEIPQENRQIVSDLAVKFADIANMINVAAEVNQNITPQNLKAFVANNIIESIASKDSANPVQTFDSRSVVQRLSALLETNGIDSQILKEANIKISMTDESHAQNIRDIVSAMKMKSSGSNLFGKTEVTSDSASNSDVIENTSLSMRAQIRAASVISKNAQTETQQQGNSQVQPEILTQTATQVRQVSIANLNKAIEANFQNAATGTNVRDNSTDISNISESSNTLSGIVDVRSGVETVNGARQQTQVAELRTNIANAANEIANIVAKNRTGGNFELKMKLFPEGLGEVLVKVTYNKGNINLNIVAENKTAETQLLSQVETLKESLASHDFNLAGFDVGARNDFENNYNRRQENGENSRTFRSHFNQQSDDGDTTNVSQNIQNLVNLYTNRIVYKTI